MIGAGIFALPASVSVRAGDWSPWLFIVVGLLTLVVVLAFAELSSYFDRSGGPALYAGEAFGPVAGFVAGWSMYVSRATAFAANVTAMAVYLAAVWPAAAAPTFKYGFIVVVAGTLTIVNYIGVKDGVRTLAVFTVLKLVPIALLVLIGLKEISGELLLPAELPALDDIGALTLLVIYAFIGFEAATFVAGETRAPQRVTPRALVYTVVGAGILYFMIVLVFVATIPAAERADATLVDVGRRLLGTAGALMVAVAAVCSIGGNLASAMISAPRLTFSLGEQGSLPPWFGKVHARHATPANSILVFGTLALVLAVSGQFVLLATASSLSRLIAYILSIASLPVVRRRATPQQRAAAFTLKFGLAIPMAALAICLWIASQSPLNTWLVTAALMLAGGVLYGASRRINA